jgi:Gas vesicle protein
MPERAFQHSVRSSNLADVLELVLDKGVVIVGDIRIKLVEVELLTIQLRLVICSVDRAKEIGLDWWNQRVSLPGKHGDALTSDTNSLEERLARLENRSSQPHATDPGALEERLARLEKQLTQQREANPGN